MDSVSEKYNEKILSLQMTEAVEKALYKRGGLERNILN